MIPSPGFSFFLPGNKEELTPDSPIWSLPLSGAGSGLDPPVFPSHLSPSSDIQVGEYFLAAKSFLMKNSCRVLKSALPKSFAPEKQGQKIKLILVKHGAFYHVLKVKVAAEANGVSSFVLNGAVSPRGLALMEQEQALLVQLARKNGRGVLPFIYGADKITYRKKEFGFFLGQWFEGFEEFHVTEKSGCRQISIWNSRGGSSYLAFEEAAPIYEQIAGILTGFYDLKTFEQVFPWHHAAGDFVVNAGKRDMAVKMISTRGYRPLVDFPSRKQYALPSLLFFLLNLSIRIRLDRLDGTGEPVFLGDPVPKACISGFLKGLKKKVCSQKQEFKDLVPAFMDFICGFSPKHLEAIIQKMVETRYPGPRELKVISGHIGSHCRKIHEIIKNAQPQDFY